MDEGIRPGLNLKSPCLKDLRVFGLGLAGLLSFFALLAWRKGSPQAAWELGAALISAALAALRPSALLPVYRAWMPVALLLGRINTLLFMLLFYYAILTPYALLLKLLGMEMLDLRFKDQNTYWKPKQPRESLEDYKKQF